MLFAVVYFRQPIIAALDWARTHQSTAVWVYFVAYIVGMVLVLPTWLFTASAGYVFGVSFGMVVAVPATMAGALVAFAVARGIGRTYSARIIAQNMRLQAVDHAIASTGLRIVMLMRVAAFLPHNLLNYFFGLSRVRVRDFALGTLVGFMPLLLVQVYVGSVTRSAADLVTRRGPGLGGWGWVVTSIGVVAAAAAILLAARTARRELQKLLAEDAAKSRLPAAKPG
jgi:uncharacterized membrane protein YdjX (TVP38/TMEM64 family)